MLVEEAKEKEIKRSKRHIAVELRKVYPMHGYQYLAPDVAELLIEYFLLLHKKLNYIAWLELNEETKEALVEILSECGLQSLLGQDIPITLEHANGKLRQRYSK